MNKKVLIVEDDPLISVLSQTVFQADSFDAEIVADEDTALATIESWKPDALLVDLMIPKLDGARLAEKARTLLGRKHLPIVALYNGYLGVRKAESLKDAATRCVDNSTASMEQLVQAVRELLAAEQEAKAKATPAGMVSGASLPPPGTFRAAPLAPAVAAASNSAAAGLKANFGAEAAKAVVQMRELLMTLTRAEDEPTKLAKLLELYQRVRSVAAQAALAEYGAFAHIASAYEAFLKELNDKPASINPSALRTLAMGVDFLSGLAGKKPTVAGQRISASILVVDDEPLSRRAVTSALEKAHLKPTAVDGAEAALPLVRERSFDLVILDVDMPGMNGFDLCKEIRALENDNKTTPVVFVTSLTGFDSRAKSTLSGGNDFIAKPFLFMELALKALMHIQKRQGA